jgi:DNA-binding SARP family transcriptional activator
LDEERAIYFLLRGEPGKARGLLERLINARELRGDETGTDTGRLRLVQVDLAEGRIEGLVIAVSVLSEKFRSQNHYYFEALASMVQAEALYLEGRPMDAVAPVMRALDLSARMDYDHWLRREIRRHPDIFALEEIAERLPADLRSEIASGVDPIDSKEESTTTTPPATGAADLTIRVLGHVEILRDPEKPFAADAWTTRRARDIFCYIATSKYRRAAKDILIDVFWPDEDPAAVEKNFHPTISHIRKGLNSRQTLKQNFLMFRDGSYQLNPELSYAIDCEEFERLIAEAEVAKRERDQTRLRRALEGAHGLYRGEFMSGVYESWVEERRAFYAEQFDRVVSALAKLSFAERKWSSTLRYASEVLKDDPFREDMHRLTMKALSAQSKPAAVKKHFENLEAVLKLELGVEPSAETRKLFQELISQ